MNSVTRFRSAALVLLLSGTALHAQTLNPVDSFAIPGLALGEFPLGLATDGTDLFLFTTLTWYTSPFDVGGSMTFTASAVFFSSLLVQPTMASVAVINPADPTTAFLTGAPGTFGNDLYTVAISPPYGSSAVTLSGVGGKPTGMATADGNAIFLSSPTPGAGIYRLPDANTDTPDLNFGNAGPGALNAPKALAFGPDGLLYALDTGDNRVVGFTTAGVFQKSFSLVGAVVASALAIDPAGRLYTMNGNGGGDIYDIYSGNHVGSLADTGDVGFNLGGKASLTYADGYLFATSGTGQNVYAYDVQAVPEAGTFGAGVALGLAVLAGRTLRRR